MLRGFTDSTGVEWRVWEVFPEVAGKPTGSETSTRTSLKNTAFANGWLCFESCTEKRRLAPIPTGWEFHDESLLEKMRDEAKLVPLRKHINSTHGNSAHGAA